MNSHSSFTHLSQRAAGRSILRVVFTLFFALLPPFAIGAFAEEPDVIVVLPRGIYTGYGYNQEMIWHDTVNGNQVISVWSPEEHYMAADDRLFARRLPTGKNIVTGTHGQYGGSKYDRSFGTVPYQPGRIWALSCNEDKGFYSPIEKQARENPGRLVIGLTPDKTDRWLSYRERSGTGYLSVTDRPGSLVDDDDLFAIGKYSEEKGRFYWRIIPRDKAEQSLAQKGIEVSNWRDSDATPANTSGKRGVARPLLIVKETRTPCPKLNRGLGAPGVTAGIAATAGLADLYVIEPWLKRKAEAGHEGAKNVLEGREFAGRIRSNLREGKNADGSLSSCWWWSLMVGHGMREAGH